MMRPRNEKTVESAIGSMFGDVQTNSAYSNGLSVDHILAGEYRATQREAVGQKRFDPCFSVLSRAILTVLARMSGCGLGSPLSDTRRLIATSRFARGFSFGVNRNHGIIAPAFFDGLMSHGKPSGLPLPSRRSANPCDVPHPHGRRLGIPYSPILGIKAMMLTLSRSVSTAFPSIPEPIYKPVTSTASNASNYDVTGDLSAIFECCTNEYESAGRDPSLFHKTIRFNVLRGVIEDVMQFCDETLDRACNPNRVMGVRHG